MCSPRSKPAPKSRDGEMDAECDMCGNPVTEENRVEDHDKQLQFCSDHCKHEWWQEECARLDREGW